MKELLNILGKLLSKIIKPIKDGYGGSVAKWSRAWNEIFNHINRLQIIGWVLKMDKKIIRKLSKTLLHKDYSFCESKNTWKGTKERQI